MIEQLEDKSIKDFWAIPVEEKVGVSPISKPRPNNSSQDISKDLLELDSYHSSQNKRSYFKNAGDKTMGTSKRKQ
jgi:hypothetical protein